MSENIEHHVHFTKLAWWMVFLRGLIALFLGVFLLIEPVKTVEAFVWLYGAFMVADGIIAIAYGMGIFGRPNHRGAPIARGLLAIVAGVIVMVWPNLTAVAVFYLVAIWAIIAGIVEIIEAFSLRDDKYSRWYFDLASGLVYLLLGILMIGAPTTSVIALLWMIALMLVISGSLMLVVAFLARSTFSYIHPSPVVKGKN